MDRCGRWFWSTRSDRIVCSAHAGGDSVPRSGGLFLQFWFLDHFVIIFFIFIKIIFVVTTFFIISKCSSSRSSSRCSSSCGSSCGSLTRWDSS